MTDLLAVTIVGANGDLFACDEHSRPYRLGPGQVLFGLPPVEAPEMPAGGLLAGSFDGRARYGARAFRVRLIVDCDTPQALLEALQRLSAAVSPVIPGTNRGRNCQVLVTRPDGEVRAISARYTGGLDGLAIETGRDTALPVDLIFRASDPTWASLDMVDARVSFPVTGSGAEATDFNATMGFDQAGQPFDGFQSTEAAGTAAVTLVNLGDAEAWPTYEVTGAATAVEVMSRTTGYRWRWAGSLASGSTLTVVTDDRSPSVRVGATNSYGGIAAGSRLFALVGGENVVAFSVAGADTNTRIAITWQHRQLTA